MNKHQITNVPDDLWRIPAEVNDIKTMLTLDDVRKACEAERKQWIELNGVSPDILDIIRSMELLMERLRDNPQLLMERLRGNPQ